MIGKKLVGVCSKGNELIRLETAAIICRFFSDNFISNHSKTG